MLLQVTATSVGPAGRKQVAGRNQSTVTHRREQRKVSGTSLAPTAASGRILLLPRPTANPVNCACLGSSIGQLTAATRSPVDP